jgi:hypothetical protein
VYQKLNEYEEYYVLEYFNGLKVVIHQDGIKTILKYRRFKRVINLLTDSSKEWKSYNGTVCTSNSFSDIHIIKDYKQQLKNYKPRIIDIATYICARDYYDTIDQHDIFMDLRSKLAKAEVHSKLPEEKFKETVYKANMLGIDLLVDINTLLVHDKIQNKTTIYTMQPGIIKN